MTRVDFKLSLNTDQNENYIQFSHKGEYYGVTEVLLSACSQNESGGISSRISVYIIAVGAYHQPKAVFTAA